MRGGQCFYVNRPMPAYGRQGLDWIVGPEYSFRVFLTWKMKSQPGTRKNHENRPGTMNIRPGTMKTHLQQRFSISATSFCIYATRFIYTEAQQNSFDPKNVTSRTWGPILPPWLKNVTNISTPSTHSSYWSLPPLLAKVYFFHASAPFSIENWQLWGMHPHTPIFCSEAHKA